MSRERHETRAELRAKGDGHHDGHWRRPCARCCRRRQAGVGREVEQASGAATTQHRRRGLSSRYGPFLTEKTSGSRLCSTQCARAIDGGCRRQASRCARRKSFREIRSVLSSFHFLLLSQFFLVERVRPICGTLQGTLCARAAGCATEGQRRPKRALVSFSPFLLCLFLCLCR